MSICSLFLMCLLPMVALGEINKCIINGVTVYTERQCPEYTSLSLETNITYKTPTESLNVSEGSYESSRWYNDYVGYKDALNISVSKSAPIIIYGYTDWCPYCKKLESTLLSNTEVKKVLARFVKVKLNPEHSSRDKDLFDSWGGTGYPTLLVQDGEDSMPRKMQPFIKQDDKWGTISKEAFISTLRVQLDNSQE
ncbi:MAG: thioredoxin family protein [Methylococcales bacterium]